MFSKVLAVVVLLAVAYCQEHSHSYKLHTLVKHEEPKQNEHHSIQIPIQTYHAAPSHEYYSGGQNNGHAVSSQSIIRHDSGHQEQSQEDFHHYIVPVHHEPAPVHEIVSIKAAPRIEIHSGGQSHGHAVSSQSIVRHDSGHKEQSQGGSHFVVATPVHQTVSLHSAPIQEVYSGGQSYGHAVSSQNIIRHDNSHKEQSQQVQGGSHYVVATPVHQTVSLHSAPIQDVYSGGQSYGHATSSQNIIRHDNSHKEQSQQVQGGSHYVVAKPVHQTVSLHSAPIQEVYSGGQSYGHAVSSQNIIRHDNSHKEQSQQVQGGSHYVVATPVHKTVSLKSTQENHSSGKSYGQAVSSQSIIRHESGHNEQSQGDGHYFLPIEHHATPIHTVNLHAAPSHEIHSESQGHAVSSQNIIRHGSQKSNEESGHYIIPAHHEQHAAPIHQTVIQATPIHHYIQESGHKEQSHQYEESDHEEYYAHPKYEFEYKVQDPHSGDNKFQHESRDGDVVKGVYSLHEADGSIRTVEYSADKHSGFNALVHNSEPSKHEQQPHHH